MNYKKQIKLIGGISFFLPVMIYLYFKYAHKINMCINTYVSNGECFGIYGDYFLEPLIIIITAIFISTLPLLT